MNRVHLAAQGFRERPAWRALKETRAQRELRDPKEIRDIQDNRDSKDHRAHLVLQEKVDERAPPGPRQKRVTTEPWVLGDQVGRQVVPAPRD